MMLLNSKKTATNTQIKVELIKNYSCVHGCYLVLAVLFNDLCQLCRLHHSGLPPFDLSVLEKNQSGNASYLVGCCSLGILIHIYFDYAGFFPYVFLYIIQYRSHHLAGSAPGGKEIHQHRLVLIYGFFKCHILSFLILFNFFKLDLIHGFGCPSWSRTTSSRATAYIKYR